MTETIKHENLAAALVAAQAEFGVIAKDAANPFFKSFYADLPAVMREAQPVLAKHGLAVSQEPGYDYFTAGDKTTLIDTLTTVVIHESGDERRSTMQLRPVKNDPQAQGSAITYARRYAYMAVLGLVADVDDDGAKASRPRTAAKAKSAPADDGVDTAALNAANAELKAVAKEIGKEPKQVVADFAAKFPGDNLTSTRSIENLQALTADYKARVA